MYYTGWQKYSLRHLNKETPSLTDLGSILFKPVYIPLPSSVAGLVPRDHFNSCKKPILKL